jgi:hypothetical protein
MPNNWQGAGKWIGFYIDYVGWRRCRTHTSQKYNMYEQYPGFTVGLASICRETAKLQPSGTCSTYGNSEKTRAQGKENTRTNISHTMLSCASHETIMVPSFAVQKLLVPARINGRVFSKYIWIACMVTCSAYVFTRMKYYHKYVPCLLLLGYCKKDSYMEIVENYLTWNIIIFAFAQKLCQNR